jgi:transcriptional regulator with GAF, ATPase, and Fis domain
MTPSQERLISTVRLLIEEEDPARTAAAFLEGVVALAGAESGFVVMRQESGSFEQVFEVGAAPAKAPLERRFSRTLVREAIAGGEVLHLPNLAEDKRLASSDSARVFGPVAVLVAPLRAADEVWGVVYLENRGDLGAFDPERRTLLAALAELAGLSLSRASRAELLRRRNQSLEDGLFARYDFKGIVTRDQAMLEILRLVGQIAPADAPVLILGETGTGKELVARALHVNSHRRARPLVTVNCSALSATLLESELFGHVAGAFTDARRDRPGRLAAAHGGTLFLDEIGEIPLEVQVKLLRFLQFGEIQRVGSDRVEKVDVRVIAATHRDLRKAIAAGSFREDLFFRLRVLDFVLPPLRERKGDLPLLIDHFLRLYWKGASRPRLSTRLLDRLERHSFPGNVRELAHLIERICLLAGAAAGRGEVELDASLLPAELRQLPDPAPAAPSPAANAFAPAELTAAGLEAARSAGVESIERAFLEALLVHHGDNVSRAARESGIHRSHLQKMLARHRLTPRRYSEKDDGGAP